MGRNNTRRECVPLGFERRKCLEEKEVINRVISCQEVSWSEHSEPIVGIWNEEEERLIKYNSVCQP